MVAHKCTFDGNCQYETDRSDVLKRHIRQKHLKIRKRCQCGVPVAPSGWARHKRICKINKQSEITPAEPSEIVTIEPSDGATAEKIVKIEVTLHVSTSSDGHILVRHDDIEYEGVQLALVVASTAGKLSQINSIGTEKDYSLMLCFCRSRQERRY